MAIRRALHANGLRFYVDRRIGQGRSAPRPDIVFPGPRIAVFVDGCFWHACPEHGHVPLSNPNFWMDKFEANCRRDRQNDDVLRSLGWAVIRVWEHEDPLAAAQRITEAVRASTDERRIRSTS